MHYARWRRFGDPEKTISAAHGQLMKWLQDHVDYQGDDCLIWPFGRNGKGYGAIKFNGTMTVASRVMCILAHGQPDQPELEAAHSCGRGHEACTSPRHLRWASSQENANDKFCHAQFHARLMKQTRGGDQNRAA